MSIFAVVSFSTMIFGFENICTPSICSNALSAIRKASTESWPPKPEALRHVMSSAVMSDSGASVRSSGISERVVSVMS